MRPAWFPDWRGECVAIVASGPSVCKADVDRLHDRLHVIAIKKNVELCPWADVVYGCDAAWWRSVMGLPSFKGLKVSWVEGGAKYFPDVHPVQIEKMKDVLIETPGIIGAGGNSGFQALNLAVQFGARGVCLVGFDMKATAKPHWYGRNSWGGANNPSDSNFERWRRSFQGVAAHLASMDVQVVNASPDSALGCFPRKTIETALADWGL